MDPCREAPENLSGFEIEERLYAILVDRGVTAVGMHPYYSENPRLEVCIPFVRLLLIS